MRAVLWDYFLIWFEKHLALACHLLNHSLWHSWILEAVIRTYQSRLCIYVYTRITGDPSLWEEFALCPFGWLPLWFQEVGFWCLAWLFTVVGHSSNMKSRGPWELWKSICINLNLPQIVSQCQIKFLQPNVFSHPEMMPTHLLSPALMSEYVHWQGEFLDYLKKIQNFENCCVIFLITTVYEP